MPKVKNETDDLNNILDTDWKNSSTEKQININYQEDSTENLENKKRYLENTSRWYLML